MQARCKGLFASFSLAGCAKKPMQLLFFYSLFSGLFFSAARAESNDSHNAQIVQIDARLARIKQLISKQKHLEAAHLLDDLTSRVTEHGTPLQTGLIFYTKGDNFYKQKQYTKALEQYRIATQYLTNGDDNTRKLLAACYHQIAQSYKHLKKVDESVVHYQQSLAIQRVRGDQPAIAKALKNLAMSENRQGAYVSALEHALQSIEIQKQYSPPKDLAQILLATGIIYRNIGHYEKSLEFVKQAEILYEREGDIAHLAEVENQTGLIYTSLKQFDNARSFYLKTLSLPIEQVKPETRAAAFREIGRIDYEKGHFDTAATMLDTAAAIYQSLNNSSKVALTYLLSGRVYIAQGYLNIAGRYLRKSLAFGSQSAELQAMALIELGLLALTTDPKQATEQFVQALAFTQQYESTEEQKVAYQGLKQAAKTTGDIAKALEYSEQVNRLTDAIHQQAEEAELAKVKVILESDKLERDLLVLTEKVKLEKINVARKNDELKIIKQANRIAELEVKEQQTTNFMLMGLLSLCLLIVFWVYRGFKATKVRNRELDYLASRDSLTGCYNRRALFNRLTQVFDSEQPAKQCSIILIDIDSFKAVNDQYGHSKGDDVLCGVAKVLKRDLTEQDCLARLGGEEFCVLLTDARASQAEGIAEQMRQQVENEEFSGVQVTCSFGVAFWQADVASHDEIIERADKALYQSKSNGRNQATVWAPA